MMEDSDLQNLKNIAVPPPSDAARKRAMHAASHAFEAAEAEQENKNEKTSQGFDEVPRLIHSFNQQLWSFIMNKQLIAGTALASVLAITVSTALWQKDEIVTLREEANITVPVVSEKVADLVEYEADDFAQAAPKKEMKSTVQKAGRTANMAALAPPPQAQIIAGSNAPAPASMTESIGRADMATMSRQSIRTAPGIVAQDAIQHHAQYEGHDKFEDTTPNPVNKVSEKPVSTFSVDVDTASYAFMRKALNNGHLPQKDAVRIEEMVNYFDYDYPLPESAEQPFKPTVAVYPTPWNPHTKLMHIGIKGHDIIPTKKPRSNLVFLLDVSGSMNNPDKLPLLKNAFRLLVENMHPEDTVSIVTYAGHAGTALEPTKVAEKSKILSALDQLHSGGSTAGAQGIKQAYALAEQSFDKKGVNRVILATDGDFNVGITNREELKGFIERKRDSGIFLSVLGFGRGNYNDALMQTLAQNGNGNAAYIDTLSEARKVLVDEASSTLFPIAKDVKIQVEFNPNQVSEYRLVGYETRMLKREDFNNDKVDAGDIGSGHAVTAIYEITPVGSKANLVDELRYQKEEKKPTVSDDSGEYAFLKMRYKLPNEETSKLIELPINHTLEKDSISQASGDIRFAASVAAFGQLLKGESHLGDFSYDDVIELAKKRSNEQGFPPLMWMCGK
jgi:Ca-activated chloride channel family protein